MTLYTKQTWVDGSAGGTPVSAARLSHIEEGVRKAAEEVTGILDSPPGTFSEVSNLTVVMYTGSWPTRPAGLPVGQHVLWVNGINNTFPPAGVGGYDEDLDLALMALA